MAAPTTQSLLEKSLQKFKNGLTKRLTASFEATTLEALEASIHEIQVKQHAQRRIQGLHKLGRFIEAIKQYGEVIDRIYGSNHFVAFIWGPLSFLLQTTSIADDAFREILDVYESIREELPLLIQHQDLFTIRPHMTQILSDIYEEILSFQHIILRYFQQPQWRRVFDSSWNVTKAHFESIVTNIARHQRLIEKQATPLEIGEARESAQRSHHHGNDQLSKQDLQRLRDVHNWLRATNIDIDQDNHEKARAEYPGTGRWLLNSTVFQDWFNPQFPAIPPLLWLNGIPGAGKTVLASLVIEEARRLNPPPRDDGLLPTFYQKSCRSGESVLTSQSLIEELLSLAFGNCKSAYIIIDGLDECPRDERKFITRWFRGLVEDLPNTEPERLRCLFTSQDDGIARKDFAGLASIKVEAKDNRPDIEVYSRTEAQKLRQSCTSLTQEKADTISRAVVESAGGLFLLAKLIWINLTSSTSIARIDEVLEPYGFPTSINDAYSRIMERIAADAQGGAMEDVLRLLGWLVCAKRPLKWHEIQAMNSTMLEEQCISLERYSFIKSPKDLCASLVETQEDGTVEFVHLTVKFFLTEAKYVNPSNEELKLATFCIDYLNLPTCVDLPTEKRVVNGDYVFMDYAVLYWLQHLEEGVTPGRNEDEGCQEHAELMEQLAESLGIFIDQHWAAPTVTSVLSKRVSKKLQFFQSFGFYDRLDKAMASTRKQWNDFGNMDKREIALDLVDLVGRVRDLLEHIISDPMIPFTHTVTDRYGKSLFKCPRFSCKFFSQGFPSRDERDRHISKHERPFRCPEETCYFYAWGFAFEADRKKHMEENHSTTSYEDREFPTDQDIENSIVAGRERSYENEDGNELEPSMEVEPVPNPTPPPTAVRRGKKPRQTQFICESCPKVFTKRSNLNSHLQSHGIERPYKCPECDTSFVRQNDFNRHRKKHKGEKFDCRGCGKLFSRKDTLDKHYESRVGRECRRSLTVFK
ncbi:hypothetical protein NPX13_g1491 [Xylaria arbuscula]|uniref:C2H2-type domain-containing protein n=1 Tax=Xylaria arbuscula TaxID=114810 RepID=A0A9W8NKY0_9PEZI|nr:hypothetical protein NPX13_g1491 [Xylaria arbuscula]